MKKLLATAVIAVLALAGAASDASAWTKKSTVTTARGTYTKEATGSCLNGICTRAGSTTGPNGKSVSSTGSITRTQPGQFDYTRTVTGPNGGTATRNGTITVTPGN